jgi:F-type H+-transporting ATPase subunit alpha
MVELLKQGQYAPLDVVDEVLVIYIGTSGFIDDVPVNRVQEWEAKFIQFMHDQKPEVRQALADKQELTDEIVAMIKTSVSEFKGQWNASHKS